MTDGVIELFRDVAGRLPDGLVIRLTDAKGVEHEVERPRVGFLFGSPSYVKEQLDAYSKGTQASLGKLPLVALFCPVRESRGLPGGVSEARVNLLVACSTRREWLNEERLERSFVKVLRPIYRRLLEELLSDVRLEWGYDGEVAHAYSENYSYGRYGAYDEASKKLSEPIDAINITNLKIRINTKLSCRYEKNENMRGRGA